MENIGNFTTYSWNIRDENADQVGKFVLLRCKLEKLQSSREVLWRVTRSAVVVPRANNNSIHERYGCICHKGGYLLVKCNGC